MASSSTDIPDVRVKSTSSSSDQSNDVTGCTSLSPDDYPSSDMTSQWESTTPDTDRSCWDHLKLSEADQSEADPNYLHGDCEVLSDGSGSANSDPQSKMVHSTGTDLSLERRYKIKPLKDKTCFVCGDKALGYNFNAISCESCKAFFRRNAFKEIRGRCDGNCEVTIESRSYCKKCRLRKCFEVGMKKDLILNDQQKQIRRIKIQENRFRRQGIPVPIDLQAQAVALATAPLPPAQPNASVCSAPTSTTQAGPPRPPSPQPSVREKVEKDPDLLTHTFAQEGELDEMTGLDENAKTKIQEVLKAFKLSFDGPMERNPMATPTGTDFLNMADTSVRRLVKMAKHLASFCCFSQEDQVSLLKGAVVEVLVLRSAKMFDTSTRGWFVNKGGQQHMVSATSMFSNQESMSFFQQYQRFATSLLLSTHHDNIVLMMMIVMTVMSPDRSSVKSTNEIAKTQEEYASLLKHYIEVRYPDDELMFARVLQKLADVRDLNETHTRMLMHMNVHDLEPLIVEIFDLSS